MSTPQNTPQKRATAPRNADAARILAQVAERTQRAQKGVQQGKKWTTYKLTEPTFRGPRSVLLRLGGLTCAIPAGAQIAVGVSPKKPSAVVLDAEKLVHLLVAHQGQIREVSNLSPEEVTRLRKMAFPAQA